MLVIDHSCKFSEGSRLVVIICRKEGCAGFHCEIMPYGTSHTNRLECCLVTQGFPDGRRKMG